MEQKTFLLQNFIHFQFLRVFDDQKENLLTDPYILVPQILKSFEGCLTESWDQKQRLFLILMFLYFNMSCIYKKFSIDILKFLHKIFLQLHAIENY